MAFRTQMLVALAALPVVFGGGVLAAESGVEGAWVDQNLDCSAIYVMTGKGARFKQPVDLFSPAFIISGKTLKTPQAACRLKKVTDLEDRKQLQLSCANSVSEAPVLVQMAKGPDGTLVRYMDSNDKSGSRYKLCK